jgi:hypothetical protein
VVSDADACTIPFPGELHDNIIIAMVAAMPVSFVVIIFNFFVSI